MVTCPALNLAGTPVSSFSSSHYIYFFMLPLTSSSSAHKKVTPKSSELERQIKKNDALSYNFHLYPWRALHLQVSYFDNGWIDKRKQQITDLNQTRERSKVITYESAVFFKHFSIQLWYPWTEHSNVLSLKSQWVTWRGIQIHNEDFPLFEMILFDPPLEIMNNVFKPTETNCIA